MSQRSLHIGHAVGMSHRTEGQTFPNNAFCSCSFLDSVWPHNTWVTKAGFSFILEWRKREVSASCPQCCVEGLEWEAKLNHALALTGLFLPSLNHCCFHVFTTILLHLTQSMWEIHHKCFPSVCLSWKETGDKIAIFLKTKEATNK